MRCQVAGIGKALATGPRSHKEQGILARVARARMRGQEACLGKALATGHAQGLLGHVGPGTPRRIAGRGTTSLV